MKQVIAGVVFFGLLIAGAQGCLEEPNPVGSRLLPPSDFLKLDTTTVTANKTYTEQVIPNTTMPVRVLVGKTSEYESWGILRFSPIPDSLLFVTVISAELNLRATYHFGDSLAPFSMDVHKVLKSWGTDSLTIDSLKAPGFFESTPMSIVNAGTVGDTATVSIPLDTAIVRQWLNSPLDTVVTNWGVLLKPTNSSVIKGFATSIASTVSHRPQLVARYIRSGLTRIDTLRLTGSVEAFTAFTNNTSWLMDSTRISVHNGLASRGFIDFTISALPPRSTIHKAILELTLDPAASQFNSHTRDSLFAYFIDTSGVVLTGSGIVSEPPKTNGQKVYQFQVTNFVQFWSRNTSLQKIAVGGYSEAYSLDSFVFYGAQSMIKPKLIITFSPIQ